MELLLTYLINFLCFLAAFAGMEFIAWATHKYVMHGFLWVLHKSHHRPRKGPFELNDLFAVIFATPAIVLIFLGASEFDYRFWIGLGITAYGIAYFLVHDVFVHQRLRIFRKTKNRYFSALRFAHKIHHKSERKEDGKEFGFLWVNPRHFNR